jgi:hypothetical protein
MTNTDDTLTANIITVVIVVVVVGLTTFCCSFVGKVTLVKNHSFSATLTKRQIKLQCLLAVLVFFWPI